MKIKLTSWLCLLWVISLLGACTTVNGGPPIEKSRLNIVDELGLENSVRLELLKFDAENLDSENDYIPVNNITNAEQVNEVIFLLDEKLEEAPALLCIPEYLLRFWLEDGSNVELGFSCEDAHFLTGNQPGLAGRQFLPPAKFTGLVEYYLDIPRETPESINLLKAAEFGNVIMIEVFEQNLGSGSAEVTPILTVEDVEIVEEILLGLSGDFSLSPRLRCPVKYFISFTMDDDRIVTFGFMCEGDETGILRGDQDYFDDQDIHLGSEFVDLFEKINEP